MVHAATHIENNMDSKVEISTCSIEKEKKPCFRMVCFYDRLHLSLKVTNGFHGIRF